MINIASSIVMTGFLTSSLSTERAFAQGNNFIRICINGLLYEQITSDGAPSRDTFGTISTRTEVDEEQAVRACADVSTLAEATDVRTCVNGLLYEQITSDGAPSRDTFGTISTRTEMDVEAAVDGCTSDSTALSEDRTEPPEIAINALVFSGTQSQCLSRAQDALETMNYSDINVYADSGAVRGVRGQYRTTIRCFTANDAVILGTAGAARSTVLDLNTSVAEEF